MTYNVFSGTLNPTHSLTQSPGGDIGQCGLPCKKVSFTPYPAVQ